jgi:hypothetical protein
MDKFKKLIRNSKKAIPTSKNKEQDEYKPATPDQLALIKQLRDKQK